MSKNAKIGQSRSKDAHFTEAEAEFGVGVGVESAGGSHGRKPPSSSLCTPFHVAGCPATWVRSAVTGASPGQPVWGAAGPGRGVPCVTEAPLPFEHSLPQPQVTHQRGGRARLLRRLSVSFPFKGGPPHEHRLPYRREGSRDRQGCPGALLVCHQGLATLWGHTQGTAGAQGRHPCRAVGRRVWCNNPALCP